MHALRGVDRMAADRRCERATLRWSDEGRYRSLSVATLESHALIETDDMRLNPSNGTSRKAWVVWILGVLALIVLSVAGVLTLRLATLAGEADAAREFVRRTFPVAWAQYYARFGGQSPRDLRTLVGEGYFDKGYEDNRHGGYRFEYRSTMPDANNFHRWELIAIPSRATKTQPAFFFSSQQGVLWERRGNAEVEQVGYYHPLGSRLEDDWRDGECPEAAPPAHWARN